MNEMNPPDKNVTPRPDALEQPAAGQPIKPGPPPSAPAAIADELPKRAGGGDVIADANALAAVTARPSPAPAGYTRGPGPAQMAWVLPSAALLLLLVLLLFIGRARHKVNPNLEPASQPKQEEVSSVNDYKDVIAKNLSLREPKYSAIVLQDDAFAGQAPRAVRQDGPLLSRENDPLLAALADAFAKRLEAVSGSQAAGRGNAASKITRGDFYGFKIVAVEKTENRNVVSAETTVTTPRHGLIKSVNHVLQAAKDTDFPGFVQEMRQAGLEFFVLPAAADEKTVRVQIRPIRFFGRPIAPEVLISGKSVGGITLGTPVARMEKTLAGTHIVLKRKVLVNDIYYDVYKVSNLDNEPQFYVYEKEGAVWGISILGDGFKTAAGIGIGSSLGLLRASYPSIKLGYSEKKTPFVQLEGVDGIFIIQGDGVDFAKKIFPNEAKVISILIGDSPEFE